MINIEYDRMAAVEYAKKWALSRNPIYYDYEQIGGDCTNFVSQCVYAGCGVMNYNENNGWYYLDANNKSPSWSGVSFFYDFMLNNQGVGPYGIAATLGDIIPGDVIQLGNNYGIYYHTLILTDIVRTRRGIRYLVCAHSVDSYMRDLRSYNFRTLRCIHISGARAEQ